MLEEMVIGRSESRGTWDGDQITTTSTPHLSLLPLQLFACKLAATTITGYQYRMLTRILSDVDGPLGMNVQVFAGHYLGLH